MTAELAWGREIVRRTARTTWMLLATSLVLLVLLVAAYANLSMRQRDMQDSIREDALWAVYQTGREARSLLEVLKDAGRRTEADRETRDLLLLRYDILYSRQSVVENGIYGRYFTEDPDVLTLRGRVRSNIVAMEHAFEIFKAADPDPAAILDLQPRVAAVVTDSEDLLVRTNSLVSAARADARSEVLRLQNATAWIVLALGLSVALLVFSLVRRLKMMRLAGESIKGVAEQLSRAFEAAESGNKAKSEFMATMGHEIRTPLNAILGMAELLSHSRLSTEDADSVRAIRTSGTALLEIINEILDFAKIEHGDETTELVPFDPGEVARQAMAVVEGRALDRGNVLELSTEVPRGLFLGDPTRLRRVLLNLLSNATKFTENGHVRVAIREVGPHDAPRLRFVVADSGIGIPDDARHLLFQAFSQVDGTIGRRFGGTGLGLAICKRIVEGAGGAIGVDSEVGIGSRFWFEIPAGRAAPDAEEAVVQKAAEPEVVPRLEILLVEDNAFNRKVATRFLELLGQTVEVAVDGAAAVRMTSERRFDLVLMDMQMPVMDGIEATRRIRGQGGRNGKVPILALTANASDKDRRRCAEAGMDGFEPKPISMAQLSRLIVRVHEGMSRGPATEERSECGSSGSLPRRSEVSDIDDARVAELVAVIGQEGLDELRDAFFADAASLLSDLRRAMSNNDRALSDRVLHTIKGAAANIGYQSAAQLAESLRGGDLGEVAERRIANGLDRLAAMRAGS